GDRSNALRSEGAHGGRAGIDAHDVAAGRTGPSFDAIADDGRGDGDDPGPAAPIRAPAFYPTRARGPRLDHDEVPGEGSRAALRIDRRSGRGRGTVPGA